MARSLSWIETQDVERALARMRSESREPSRRAPPRPADRIAALASWVERTQAPSGWFLADVEGFVLHARGWSEREVAEAVGLLAPHRAPGLIEGRFRCGDRSVRAAWLDTSFGWVVIAFESEETNEIRGAAAAVLASGVTDASR